MNAPHFTFSKEVFQHANPVDWIKCLFWWFFSLCRPLRLSALSLFCWWHSQYYPCLVDILIHVPLMDHSSCKWFWNWPPIFSNDGQALLEASNCGETHGEAMVALQKPNFWSRCRENVSEILDHVGYLRIRWIEAGWTAAANWLKASHFFTPTGGFIFILA